MLCLQESFRPSCRTERTKTDMSRLKIHQRLYTKGSYIPFQNMAEYIYQADDGDTKI